MCSFFFFFISPNATYLIQFRTACNAVNFCNYMSKSLDFASRPNWLFCYFLQSLSTNQRLLFISQVSGRDATAIAVTCTYVSVSGHLLYSRRLVTLRVWNMSCDTSGLDNWFLNPVTMSSCDSTLDADCAELTPHGVCRCRESKNLTASWFSGWRSDVTLDARPFGSPRFTWICS